MRIFFSAGEPSGDQRASEVIQALKSLDSNIQIDALGGPLMQQAGAHITHDLVNQPVIGLRGILSRLPYFRRILKETLSHIKTHGTDMLVLVDYPGFNLRLAEAARREGIRTVYYIGPQIWAWGGGRIHRIKRAICLMLVVFDFEKKLYEDAGVKVQHVGHPLLDQLNFNPVMNFYGDTKLSSDAPLLGLFPGSRTSEVNRIFSVMLEAGAQMRRSIPDLQLACATVPSVSRETYEHEIARTGTACVLLEGATHGLMKSCNLALVASGTATLETALFGTPQLILYRTDAITAMIVRMVLRLPGIGLVNVVAREQIVPEFLQGNCRADCIAPVALDILRNEEARSQSQQLGEKLKVRLGQPGAAMRAANAMLDLARS